MNLLISIIQVISPQFKSFRSMTSISTHILYERHNGSQWLVFDRKYRISLFVENT